MRSIATTRHRPLPWGRSLAAVLTAVLILAGCATSGVNRGDFNLVSLEEEWQLGNQLEQDLARQLRLVNDPEALRYINQLGQQIVNQTDMRNLPWEFHIVADPAINAFNIPGGHVYVNTGLIAAADNASELAGVLAHEIAHGVSRHATERLTKAYGLNAVAGLLLGQNPAIYEQLLAQIIGTGAIAKFSRSDERESDQLGIRYMYNAGINPEGLVNIFQDIMSQGRESRGAARFFATHPLTSERIADARAQIRSLPNRSGLRTTDAGFQTLRQRVSRYG